MTLLVRSSNVTRIFTKIHGEECHITSQPGTNLCFRVSIVLINHHGQYNRGSKGLFQPTVPHGSLSLREIGVETQREQEPEGSY